MEKQKNKLKLSLLLSIIGWGVAFYLLHHHVRLHTVGLESPSFCSINAYFDCDAVALSKYSELFGIPTAAYLLAFFMFMIALSIWALTSLSDKEEESYQKAVGSMWAASGIFSMASLVMAFISFVLLQKLCLFCTIAYFLIFALFAITHKARLRHFQIADLRWESGLSAAVWGLTFFMFFVPSILNNANDAAPKIDDKLIVQEHLMLAPKNISYDGYPSSGASAENAIVTFVEFSDYQCPYCARFSKLLTPVFNALADRVRVVYKPYPLDSSCNPNMKQPGHPLACTAAKITLCTYKEKGNEAFKRFHHKIFEEQSRLSLRVLRDLATSEGFDDESFKACLENSEIHQLVVRSIEDGTAAGVEGTPSFFANQRRVPIINPAVVRALLQAYSKK